MATLTNTLSEKGKIVRNRWRARQYFWQAWQGMPTSIEIRNDKEGERLAPEDRYTISLQETLTLLRHIGDKIFHRNFEKHYVAISAENNMRISYSKLECTKFCTASRIRTKLGRYITRNFPDEMEIINERALDLLVEKFTALAADDLDACFEIISGEEIIERYSNNFADESCMTNDGSVYTRMYGNTPGCKMLCLDDGKYQGRALLWDTDNGTFLDRIYPNSGPHIQKYELYCKKHNINMRIDNHMPSTGPQSDDGLCWPKQRFRTTNTSYSLNVSIPEEYAPFVDTMHWGKWLDKEAGEATLYTDPEDCDNRPDFALNGIGGGVQEFYYRQCRNCELKHLRSTMQSVRDVNGHTESDKVCMACIDEYYKSCQQCGDLHENDNIINTRGLTHPYATIYSHNICVPCASRQLGLCTKCKTVIAYSMAINNKKYCHLCYPTALAEKSLNPKNEDMNNEL